MCFWIGYSPKQQTTSVLAGTTRDKTMPLAARHHRLPVRGLPPAIKNARDPPCCFWVRFRKEQRRLTPPSARSVLLPSTVGIKVGPEASNIEVI